MSQMPPPTLPPEPKPPAWWPLSHWGNYQWKTVGWVVLAAIAAGLYVVARNSDTASTSERPSSPERYRDYVWRDEVCNGDGGDFSGIFVNTFSPRDTYTFELVATLYDGQRLVDRDSEFVFDLAPGASEAVEFVFGTPGTRCVLESDSLR